MKFQAGNLAASNAASPRLEIFTLSRSGLAKWTFLIRTDAGTAAM